jgi:NADH:ubiquinone oxidoreductase subunit 5 (subunit L)/multisubunit Na+/H+ antiporter MnhA subunit
MYQNIHESWGMIIPMLVLTYFSIFKGYNRDYIISELSMGSPATNVWIDMEFILPSYAKLSPLVLGTILSLILLYILEYKYKIVNFKIIHYFNQRLYWDNILNNGIIRNTLDIAGNIATNIDNGVLKILGPVGIYRIFRHSSTVSKNASISLASVPVLVVGLFQVIII